MLASAWGLSLSLDTDHSGWWGQLSGMLVLSCSADASSDNGQELDFLVWLLPPRPLECEGGPSKRPQGLGVGRWRPDHLNGEEEADHREREPSSSPVTKLQAAAKAS